MFQVIMVKAGKMATVDRFKTLTSVQRAVGITSKEDWEVLELGDYKKHKIGVIARDQDKKRLPNNRLGIKGHFAIIGLEITRENKGTIYTFSSLTDDQVREIKLDLSIQTYHDAVAALSGGAEVNS